MVLFLDRLVVSHTGAVLLLLFGVCICLDVCVGFSDNVGVNCV